MRLIETSPPLVHTVPDWHDDEARAGWARLVSLAQHCGLDPSDMQHLAFWLLGDKRVHTLVWQVGRQQGKTAAELIWLLDRAMEHPRETEIFSVQDGSEASAKLRKELKPMAEHAGLSETTGCKFHLGAGVLFGQHLSNGSFIRTLASGKHSGRGETRVGAAAADEASTDGDGNRLGLMTPMQTAAPNAQMAITGTAGDVTSVMFEQQITDAAAKAKLGPACGVAIMYWGPMLPGEPRPEGFDPTDRDTWRRLLPGLGVVCDMQAIESAFDRLEEWQFEQEYLGVWMRTRADQCFSKPVWERIAAGENPDLSGELWLAVDCPPADDRPSIALCDGDGVVALADGCESLGDVAGFVAEVCDQYDVKGVWVQKDTVLDGTVKAWRRSGEVPVREVDVRFVMRACQGLWVAAHSSPRRVAVAMDSALIESNDTSFKRERGGGWLFARRDSTGWASPLLASALAYQGYADTMRRRDRETKV